MAAITDRDLILSIRNTLQNARCQMLGGACIVAELDNGSLAVSGDNGFSPSQDSGGCSQRNNQMPHNG
jgi:hypothetical protein